MKSVKERFDQRWMPEPNRNRRDREMAKRTFKKGTKHAYPVDAHRS